MYYSTGVYMAPVVFFYKKHKCRKIVIKKFAYVEKLLYLCSVIFIFNKK